jgi:hypothetical protein
MVATMSHTMAKVAATAAIAASTGMPERSTSVEQAQQFIEDNL